VVYKQEDRITVLLEPCKCEESLQSIILLLAASWMGVKFCFDPQNDLQSIFVKLKSSLRCCSSVVYSSALHSVASKSNTVSAREQIDFVGVFMVSGGKSIMRGKIL
jgi:hypothetical protein